MQKASTSANAEGALAAGTVHATAPGAADWLSLAAAPTFAVMAVLTGVSGDGAHEMSCAPASHTSASHMSALSGMVPMYVLMSAFHSVPWLKLVSRRRAAAAEVKSR